MGTSKNNPTGRINSWLVNQQSVPETPELPKAPGSGRRKVLQNPQPNPANLQATKEEPWSVTVILTKKGKLSSLGVGKGDTVFAEDLTSQEAKQLIAELIKKGKVRFGIGEENRDTVSYITKELKPQEAVNLIADIEQGTIDLKEELSKKGWKEVKGEETGFLNSVGELANETTISIAAGIVGEFLVTLLGPGGAILAALVTAGAEKPIQGNYSVSSGILAGVLVTFAGPVWAILIPFGVAAAAKLQPDKMSYE